MDTLVALREHNLMALAEEVCKLRGVAMAALCGPTRSKALSRARQELWWRMKHHPERAYSYPEIGRIFRRDHTTILGGVKVHARRVSMATP
jgi:chromosomal replication initiation ATPase DnaA